MATVVVNPMNSAYEEDAGRALAARYEGVDPATLHKDVVSYFPAAPAAVLDIGAGSGRDAAWLAEQGYTVLAVEPSETMRTEGARLHPDARITWLGDRLPGLDGVFRLGASFDLILLSGLLLVPWTRR